MERCGPPASAAPSSRSASLRAALELGPVRWLGDGGQLRRASSFDEEHTPPRPAKPVRQYATGRACADDDVVVGRTELLGRGEDANPRARPRPVRRDRTEPGPSRTRALLGDSAFRLCRSRPCLHPFQRLFLKVRTGLGIGPNRQVTTQGKSGCLTLSPFLKPAAQPSTADVPCRTQFWLQQTQRRRALRRE